MPDQPAERVSRRGWQAGADYVRAPSEHGVCLLAATRRQQLRQPLLLAECRKQLANAATNAAPVAVADKACETKVFVLHIPCKHT